MSARCEFKIEVWKYKLAWQKQCALPARFNVKPNYQTAELRVCRCHERYLRRRGEVRTEKTVAIDGEERT